MGQFSRLAMLALPALLAGCTSVSTLAPPLGPDDPSAELYGTRGFSMTIPQVNQKGCYQGDAILNTQSAAPSIRVRAARPLVIAIDGASGIHRCRDMVRFKPEAGHKYVAHGRPGPDEESAKVSIWKQAVSANKPYCHIAVFDETDEADIKPVQLKRVQPRQRGFTCIGFD